MYEKNRYFINNQARNKILKMGAIMAFFTFLIASTCGCIGQQKNTIKVSGAFALYPMMVIWVDEYEKLYPDIKIDVSAGGAGKGMSDALAGIVNIGMVSREIYTEEIEQGAFWISVAKDAVVATINSDNPVIDLILEKGLNRNQLRDLFTNKKESRSNKTWGQLVGNPSITTTIQVYSRSDACGAAETWADYLGGYKQGDLTNAADSCVDGDPSLAATIQNVVAGIGYNNINFVYNSKTKKPYDKLQPVPIDLNENGIIDLDEDFYDTRDDIVNAIANDIYPSPPARALHLVTKTSFSGITKNFVYWILTEGQQYVPESGYIQLSEQTITEQIEFLEEGVRPK